MNPIIKKLLDEDQADRNPTVDWCDRSVTLEIEKRDKLRRQKINKLLKENKIITAEEYHAAALIFQHGQNPKDYLKAHKLAKKAVRLGYNSKYLIAVTWDRYLLNTGNSRQKYGTQYHWDEKLKKYTLYPIDFSTNDKERERLDVPPLAKIPVTMI